MGWVNQWREHFGLSGGGRCGAVERLRRLVRPADVAEWEGGAQF